MRTRASGKQPEQGTLNTSKKSSSSKLKASSKLKLFLVFIGVGSGALILTTFILYSLAVDAEKQRLQALTQTQAGMIEAVAQFDKVYNKEFAEGGSRGATLSQLLDAHFEESGFGKTGEFVIGEKKSDKIHFLIPSRVLGGVASSVDAAAQAAEPILLALQGRSGFVTGLDYRDEEVFAWYEPLVEFDAGFVGKIDVSEIRDPYVSVIVLGTLMALLISFMVTILFHQVEFRIMSRANKEKHGSLSLKSQTIIQLTLIGCLVSVAIIPVLSIAGFVYSAEGDRRKSELASLTKGMASLINSVAIFDGKYTQNNTAQFKKAADATISQIKDSIKYRPGFGETGEIVLGVASGAEIRFLLPSRFTGLQPRPLKLDSDIAVPMRMAIGGQFGVLESLDYRGEKVLAAYHPIKYLDGGFVVKMDISEIQRPYIVVGSVNISLALFSVVFGILLAPQFIESMRPYRRSHGYLAPLKGTRTLASETHLHRFALALIVGLSGGLFLMDAISPLGLAAGIPYIGLIIAGSFVTDKKGLVLLACFVTVLVFLGFMVAPNGGVAVWQVAINRIYPVLIIWLAVIILLRTQRAEQAARQILVSAGEGIYGLNDDGITVFVNPAACEILGYSEHELLGNPMHDLVHHSHPDGSEYFSKDCPMYAAFNDGEIHRVDNEVLWRKDGTAVPVSYVSTPVYTANQLTGAVVTFNDITENKRREREIHLRAKALERSNEELEHFAYAASHDLQEPLRKIQSFSELLAKDYAGSLDETGVGYLERLSFSATRMRTLIDDLLLFSRVTSTFKIINEIELSSIVDDVLDDMKISIEKVDAKILVGTLPRIQCDREQIHLIMQNLISNSIKFKRKDTPLIIEIKSEITDENVHIIFSDNGIGFEQKFAHRIFGLFERLHARDEYSGTGIGLANCKKIAARHGGNIVAKGSLGEGATFTVTLPIESSERTL